MTEAARTYTTHGLVLTEHEFSLPLDHARPGGASIGVFAREIADPDGRDRPFLVFFQGGPGFEGARPTRHPSSPGWLDRALQDFRVLMLDQRGTGRSTPVGTLPGLSPAEQAEYLTHFRADSIVRDAELIRAELGVDRWSILGQSFGGFCVMTYLSLAPEGLREAFVTGGLAPVGRPVDDIYRATYARVLDRNRRYYERYPHDRARVLALLERIEGEGITLPTGDRLTARRFRQAGNLLGMSDGAEELHALLELPADSPAFRHDVQDVARFRAQPDLRDPARGLLRRRRRDPLVGGARHAARVRGHAGAAHRRARLSVDVRGLRGAGARCARRPSCSPRTSGRASTTPSGCEPTRSPSPRPSTPTTPTSSAPSPRRPPRSSAARAPG